MEGRGEGGLEGLEGMGCGGMEGALDSCPCVYSVNAYTGPSLLIEDRIMDFLQLAEKLMRMNAEMTLAGIEDRQRGKALEALGRSLIDAELNTVKPAGGPQ